MEQTEGLQTTEGLVQPKGLGVKFRGEFGTEETPFQINVDSERLNRLMLKIGIPQERLDNLTVELATSREGLEKVHPQQLARSSETEEYIVVRDGKREKVTIFVGSIFKRMIDETGKAADRYFKKENPQNLKTLEEFLDRLPEPSQSAYLAGYKYESSTPRQRRFEAYLKAAPPERAKRFINFLAGALAEKRIQQAVGQGILSADIKMEENRPQIIIKEFLKRDVPVLTSISVAASLFFNTLPISQQNSILYGIMVAGMSYLGGYKPMDFLGKMYLRNKKAASLWRKGLTVNKVFVPDLLEVINIHPNKEPKPTK